MHGFGRVGLEEWVGMEALEDKVWGIVGGEGGGEEGGYSGCEKNRLSADLVKVG